MSPDLQMDRAAHPSCSYKISLAWRYNSFFLYVSCQLNLASLGAILVLVKQSIEETTAPVCVFVCVSQLVPREHMEISSCVQGHNAVITSMTFFFKVYFTLKPDPWSEVEKPVR